MGVTNARGASTGSFRAPAESARTAGGAVNQRLTVNQRVLLRITKTFGVKVPVYYISIYKTLDEERQAIIREIVKSAFIKAVEQVAGLSLELRQETVNVVMPIQVNINRAEACGTDAEKRLERLRKGLEQFIERLEAAQAQRISMVSIDSVIRELRKVLRG